MILFAAVLALGYLTGLLRGGRARNISRLRIGWLPLFALAVGVVAVSREVPSNMERSLAMIGSLLLALWLSLHAARGQQHMRIAFAVLALGWCLNVIVITSNNGMPVSSWALRTARTRAAAAVDRVGDSRGSYLARHFLETPGTVLRPLADAIPIPPVHMVVSIGDLILYAGFGMVIARAMRLPPARHGMLGRLHYEPSLPAETRI